MKTMTLNGIDYVITGEAIIDNNHIVPIVAVPMMSDDEWRALSNTPEQRHRRMIRICERYHSDDLAVVTDALEDAIRELDSLINNIINERYSAYSKYHDDLVQVGRIGIMHGMKNYDTSQNLHDFELCINHEMSKFVEGMRK